MRGKRFVTPDEVDTQVFAWGTLKWMSAPDVTGAERFSMGVVLLEPGKGHTTHNHPGVEEILYFVSGTGVQAVAGERRPVGPGVLVHIPPGVDHETINTGWEQMKIVAIYSPPGPEAELAHSPDCTLVPAGQIPSR